MIIKDLTPGMAEEFIAFIDSLDFSHAEHWKNCYCQYHHTNCSGEAWNERMEVDDYNRNLALVNIRNGTMHGLLAMEGDRIIGWCCADDYQNFERLRDDQEMAQFSGRTAAVTCFIIDPDYRGKGIASRLLEEAVERFRGQGFDRVAGRPFQWTAHPQRQYKGSPAMYERLGFEKISDINGVSTYVLPLR